MSPTRYPDGNVFFRKLHWDYPRITHGKGCWLYDDAGNSYLDAVGGAFVSNIGHGVAEVADAMAAQAKKLAYASGMTLSHDAVETFATELAGRCVGGLSRVYPLSSGSDAVEAALKLARQYWAEIGKPKKTRIIAMAPSYHGNTLLALSASAREHYKTAFRGWLVDVIHIPAYNSAALEVAIADAGAENVAAFIAEPVGGSSTGAIVPPDKFWRHARDICSTYEVLLVADEILCGAGRTGSWSALEPESVVPDIQIFGKGIAGGYAPLAAVVAPTRIADVLAAGSGGLNHAQTFSHHAVSCAAGTATMRYLTEHKLVERCASMGRQLHGRLGAIAIHPSVRAVRGRGLLAGIEFVNPKTRLPFARSHHFAESLTRNALDLGLVVWPNVGHADGTNGDIVLLAPPFTVSDDELDQIVDRLRRAMTATIGQLSHL
jgi:adenosylmethionine-8-amino-7-oxononanoate aminotransferase